VLVIFFNLKEKQVKKTNYVSMESVLTKMRDPYQIELFTFCVKHLAQNNKKSAPVKEFINYIENHSSFTLPRHTVGNGQVAFHVDLRGMRARLVKLGYWDRDLPKGFWGRK